MAKRVRFRDDLTNLKPGSVATQPKSCNWMKYQKKCHLVYGQNEHSISRQLHNNFGWTIVFTMHHYLTSEQPIRRIWCLLRAKLPTTKSLTYSNKLRRPLSIF